MKKLLLPLLLLLGSISISRSQGIDLKWSEPFQYDNDLDGFFDYYLGTNKNYIYAKFSNLVVSASYDHHPNSKIKLVVFDKNTMQKVGDVQLLGYGKDLDKEDMEYYKSIVLENVIYVLWTKETKTTVEIYAQSFDSKLKKINNLKKIYEINSSRKATDNLVILYNNDIGSKILLGKEFAVEKEGDKLRFEYKIIDEQFNLVQSNQVTLPIIITKKGRRDESYTNLVCSYEFADDGNIYAQNTVKISKEDQKKLKKGEASVYPVIMQIKPESGEVKEHSIKFAKKNTFNFSSLITKNGIKLYGFFCDLEKDVKGNDTHGTFFLTLDTKSFEVTTSKFSYFTKSFLDELYAADQENQKKGKGLFKSKEAKESDNESIDDNYIIERVIEDGKDILLFCSIMRNWSETVCTTNSNGSQTCRTYYYCTKSNVTTFKLNPSGEILWAKNLDRQYTYSRWNVYDLNVISKDGNYVVIYGSAYQMNATKKTRKQSKSAEQRTDRLEYAVFNGKTGDFKKSEYHVNTLNTKKEDEKSVDADDIVVFDNKMYTECRTTKLKKKIYWWCLCPCVFTVMSWKGKWRVGHGRLGVISAI